jgi:hypothetical protein
MLVNASNTLLTAGPNGEVSSATCAEQIPLGGSGMGRWPMGELVIPVESRINWNESHCVLLLVVKAATCTEMH